ncbi:MAG TPA: glycosyltransferase [Crocinitomicaceae bacterium]|nr:glycosyltransferase [Crocinitomicaceae bacterium]
MIKVCHLTSVHKHDDTRIFFKECMTLASTGYEVFLVAPKVKSHVVNNVNILGVEVKKPSRFYRITCVAWKVMRKGLSTKAKIFHFHDPELIWVGILLRLFGKTVIFDVHENVSAQIKDKKWVVFPKLFAFIYSIMEWVAKKLFHIVIAEESYEDIYVKQAKSVTKVLNYPDLKSFNAMRNEYLSDENGILYVGLVSKLRGVFEIINALKIIDDKQIDFHFHCVGPMFDDLKKEIDQDKNYQQIKHKITFYGPLPVNEAYKLAKKSKIGLSILHPVPNYLRSFSTKIFEYMALGLPFIVSDFEIYSFVKEKNIGLCINPLSVKELAISLEKMLTNEIDLNSMRQREIATSVEYSWDSQAENLLNLYAKLTAK